MQFKHLGLAMVTSAVVMAVAACQSMDGKDPDSSAAFSRAVRKCTGLGYKPGTDAHATCVLDQGQETAYARERAISEEQACLAASIEKSKGTGVDRAADVLLNSMDRSRCKR